MKNILTFLILAVFLLSCNGSQEQDQQEEETATKVNTSEVDLPYTPTYSIDVDQNVSDEDLRIILQSYKDWETGDMQGLREAFGDSIAFNGWDGTNYNGPTESLMNRWSASRDSLSDVKIEIAVWIKNHFPVDDHHNVTLWYTETDTYTDGRVKKYNMHDINQIKDGKIVWYAQYRQAIKEE